MMLGNSRVLKRSLVVGAIALLAVGLVSILVIIRSSAGTESVTAVVEPEDSPADVAARRADFDFLDHELKYAGGYELRFTSVEARGEAFDFVDHELEYAGGYDLRPGAVGARGAAFDFADHELRYAGGYGPRPSTVGARGEAFDFADHELRYAGGYGLVPVASDGS